MSMTTIALNSAASELMKSWAFPTNWPARLPSVRREAASAKRKKVATTNSARGVMRAMLVTIVAAIAVNSVAAIAVPIVAATQIVVPIAAVTVGSAVSG